MKCRIEIQDGTIVEVNEDAQLHFVKFETRQIEKCLDYIRDTLMNSEHFAQVRSCKNFYLNPIHSGRMDSKTIHSTIDPPPGVPGVSKNQNLFFTNKSVELLR